MGRLGTYIDRLIRPTNPSGPRKVSFRRYRPRRTDGRVTCVTPDDGSYLHSFFDVCPFSPSRRYLAVTRIPFQHREPRPGELADICVIDLEEQTIEVVHRTRAWGFQLGANLNWGPTDRFLYSNDVVDGIARGIRIDLESGEACSFAGPMVHLAPDASAIIGFPLDLINATQRGYGVAVPAGWAPRVEPDHAERQGLWKTVLASDRAELLVSLDELTAHIPEDDPARAGVPFLFHSKFNRQGTRIMQVVRRLVGGDRRKHPALLTFDAEGEGIHLALSSRQWSTGHHPNWHPDGDHLIQNVPIDGVMRFCQFRFDGSDFRVLSDKHLGSGHPSLCPRGRTLMTDAKPKEPTALANGEVPIRLVDLSTDRVVQLCSIPVIWPRNRVLRLDPHPVWDRDHRRICFNGAPDKRRQVFVANLEGLV